LMRELVMVLDASDAPLQARAAHTPHVGVEAV